MAFIKFLIKFTKFLYPLSHLATPQFLFCEYKLIWLVDRAEHDCVCGEPVLLEVTDTPGALYGARIQ